MDYSICKYDEACIESVLSLTRRVLGNRGAVRKSAQFWLWKHHANPFGPSYGLLARAQGGPEVVGVRMLMRWSFQDNTGQVHRAARAVDTATHPDFQRRGIFTQLTQRAIADLQEEGVHFIFNTPNARSLPGYLKMGWQVAARLPILVRVLRPVRMAQKWLARGAPRETGFDENGGSTLMGWPDFTDTFGPAIPELIERWERNRTQVGMRTQRSLDYFDWRYGGHPHVHYVVCPLVDARKASSLNGFAIVRPNIRYHWQEGVLTELVLAKPELALARALLDQLLRSLPVDYVVAHSPPHTFERSALLSKGFLHAPTRKVNLTVRRLGDTGAGQPLSWDFSLGDLEIF